MTYDAAILDHYLAPIRPHLDAEGVTEVVVNRPGEFAVEDADGWRWVDAPDLTEDVTKLLNCRPTATAPSSHSSR